MSELDDKLLRIIERCDISNNQINDSLTTTQAVDEIKQVFQKEHYRQLPSHSDMQSLVDAGLAEFMMTGQQWYEKFVEAYENIAIYPDPNPHALVKVSQVYKAARRAAGLEDEQ